jgi:hypothetical protein
MARRLLNLLTALSLLLCVAVAVLWARSYVKADFVGFKHPQRGVAVISSGGAVYIGLSSGVGGFYFRSNPASQWGLSDSRWWPFYSDRDTAKGAWTVIIPHWLGIAFAAPVALMLRRRHRRRRWTGHCASCGYNLTGNVSGVCPECGEKGSDPTCPAPQN